MLQKRSLFFCIRVFDQATIGFLIWFSNEFLIPGSEGRVVSFGLRGEEGAGWVVSEESRNLCWIKNPDAARTMRPKKSVRIDEDSRRIDGWNGGMD